MKEAIYKWRKKANTGAHYFFYKGKKIRMSPNNVVECPANCLGSFASEYDCLGEVQEDGKVVVVDLEKKEEQKGDITLEVVPRGSGYYNVINPDNPDNPINDKALRKEDAYKLAGLPIPEKKKRKRK